MQYGESKGRFLKAIDDFSDEVTTFIAKKGRTQYLHLTIGMQGHVARQLSR